MEWGTPSKTSNGLPKSHLKNNKSKKVSRGPLPVATRPTRPSSSSPRAPRRRSRHPGEALQGRPRQGTPSPPRPRLSTEGLGRRRVLRIARGLSREASARSLISVSREAPFSVSLEAGSPAVRHPPPRPTLPTAGHVSLILSTTPAISAGQRLNVTEWPTRPEVASAPYRLGQGTAGITGHCVLTLCPRSAPTLYCVPRSPPRKQHRTNNLARVITASRLAH